MILSGLKIEVYSSHTISVIAETAPKAITEAKKSAEFRCVRYIDTVPENSYASVISLLFSIAYLMLLNFILWGAHIVLLQQRSYMYVWNHFQREAPTTIEEVQ